MCAGKIVGLQQEVRHPSPQDPASDAMHVHALRNYERFHGLPAGTATIDQLQASSAGIDGWYQCGRALEVWVGGCVRLRVDARAAHSRHTHDRGLWKGGRQDASAEGWIRMTFRRAGYIGT